MMTFRSAMVLSMLMASSAMSHAQEFPAAPPKLKDAEAQGLVRASIEELKQFMPGKVESRGPLGGRRGASKPLRLTAPSTEQP